MPKVSVIIPVYGVEKYIERSVRSLFEQTLDDIEYLFIDDCTPDKSIEILKQVLKEYPNRSHQVAIHKMEKNYGQAAVRKWGMQNATGEYVIHCDSDDWVDTDMYRTMYEKAVESSSDVVICDYQSTDGNNSIVSHRCCFTDSVEQFKREMMFQNESWSLCNKLFRRELIEKIVFYPKDNMGEDMVLVLQLISFCKVMSYIPKPFYYYYYNPSSITRKDSVPSVLDKFFQYRNNYQLIESFLAKAGELSRYRRELNWLRYSLRSFLFVKDKTCQRIRKTVFPFIEFKILFYPEINQSRRIECFKCIVKQLLCLV